MDNQNRYNQYGQDNMGQSAYSSYYDAPAPQGQTPGPQLEEPVSMGEWLIAMLLMLIPCVNIVLMFVWAFSDSEKKSKSNYFKAALIWAGISIVLGIIMTILMSVGMVTAIGSL